MCEDMNTNIEELLKLTPKCKGVNTKGMYVYRNVSQKEKKEKNKGNLYEYFLKYVKPTFCVENDYLRGKTVSVSINCKKGHFKEMLLMIQLIVNNGASYTENEKEADIFVNCDEYCFKESEVDVAIDEGKTIEKIHIKEFLKLIQYDDRYKEENYKRVCKEMVKLIKKDEKYEKSRRRRVVSRKS